MRSVSTSSGVRRARTSARCRRRSWGVRRARVSSRVQLAKVHARHPQAVHHELAQRRQQDRHRLQRLAKARPARRQDPAMHRHRQAGEAASSWPALRCVPPGTRWQTGASRNRPAPPPQAPAAKAVPARSTAPVPHSAPLAARRPVPPRPAPALAGPPLPARAPGSFDAPPRSGSQPARTTHIPDKSAAPHGPATPIGGAPRLATSGGRVPSCS